MEECNKEYNKEYDTYNVTASSPSISQQISDIVVINSKALEVMSILEQKMWGIEPSAEACEIMPEPVNERVTLIQKSSEEIYNRLTYFCTRFFNENI